MASVPELRLRSPLDAMVVAPSLTDLRFRHNLDADALAQELAGLHPRAVLAALRELLEQTSQAGIDPDAHRRFLPLFSSDVQSALEDWLDDTSRGRRVILAERFVCISATYALARSEPDGRNDHGEAVRLIAAGSLVAGDLLRREPTDILLELSRLTLFAPSEGWGDQLPEAQELVRLLSAPRRSIDFDGNCRKSAGVSLEEAWSMTALLATLTGRSTEPLRFAWPAKFSSGGYSEETLLAGKHLWVQTLDECVERARVDIDSPGYSLRALSDRPIVVDGEQQLVPWPRAFADKALPFGLFALVDRTSKAQGVSGTRIREELGQVVEERVAELLAEQTPSYRHLLDVIDEAEQRRQFSGSAYRPKQSDWLLIEDDYVVALEVRNRPVSLLGQATGTADDLANDIEEAVVRKLVQCDHSLDNAARHGLMTGRKAIAIVVNGSPVPVSPVLIDHVDAQLTADRAPFRASHDYTIAVLELSELRQVLRGARKKGLSLGRVIEKWRSHPALGTIGFYDWATQHMPSATRNPSKQWLRDVGIAVAGFDVAADTSERASQIQVHP